MNIKRTVIVLLLTMMPAMCFAESFSPDSSYDICFTPGDNCADKIIKTISQAKKQILVQAYRFNDNSIAKALASAKSNGVDVRIIFDQSQIEQPHNLINFFRNNKITPIIDSLPKGIAHNKIIIVDNLIVIGGSYNYTYGAAKKNAENVIIIKDAEFAQKYVKNWYKREQKSESYK
jgi:phosphatidylserine/phosphatidylglycerophosphate/cardiolipin synthase-like enzyme